MFAGPCIIGQLCMQLPFLRNFDNILFGQACAFAAGSLTQEGDR